MIDHMFTFQGQAVPVVVRDSVFEIYEIVEACAGCFFHMHMVGISMKNVHHFIQSTAVTGNSKNLNTSKSKGWFIYK